MSTGRMREAAFPASATVPPDRSWIECRPEGFPALPNVPR